LVCILSVVDGVPVLQYLSCVTPIDKRCEEGERIACLLLTKVDNFTSVKPGLRREMSDILKVRIGVAIRMRFAVIFAMTTAVIFAQEGPGGGRMSFIRMSPILNAVDADQDGTLSAAEIAAAPGRLRQLDKNGDGKLTRDEAGLQMGGGRGRGEGGGGGDEPPAPAPSAEELTATLMMFDANHNGKLEKSEVPERMQGMFERGDTNHDGILTRDEIAKLAEANRQQLNSGGRGGDGRGRGRGGPDQFDLAFNARGPSAGTLLVYSISMPCGQYIEPET
jgi:Ca2+-binding EF-hand superfamily protein